MGSADPAPRASLFVMDLVPRGDTWTILGHGPSQTSHYPPSPLADAAFSRSLEELRDKASELVVVDSPDAPTIEAELQRLAHAIGERLTAVLFSPETREALCQRLREGRVRLLLRGDGAEPDIDRAIALPWELVMPTDDGFPVREQKLEIVREIIVPGSPELSPPRQPFRVSVVIAAPEDQNALRYEEEAFRLHRALVPLGHNAFYTDLGEVEDLVATVQRSDSSAVHFRGHGLPGALLFEDEYGLGRVVEVQELIDKLAPPGCEDHRPKLFFLSSCHGTSSSWCSRGSELREVLGYGPSTAAALHRSGIVQVVGYFGPVRDVFSTRAAEAFYQAVARGQSTLDAVTNARNTLLWDLDFKGTRFRYPLAWMQLVLYHRGPDYPLALPLASQVTARPERLRRETIQVSGLPTLEFGFIGQRRIQHEIRRKIMKEGKRFVVLYGLGGLGKTALASQILVQVLTRDEQDRMILRCKDLDLKNRNPYAALREQVEEHGFIVGIEAWGESLCKLRERLRQESGDDAKCLEETLLLLRQARPKLVIYVDNAETLQSGPCDSDPDALGNWLPQTREFPSLLNRLSLGGLVLLSTRYAWRDLDSTARVCVRPMIEADSLRLIDAFDALWDLSPKTQERIAEIVDGHPRTLEYLDRLVGEQRAGLPSPHVKPEDEWATLIEPVLPSNIEQIRADLLLEQLWCRLSTPAREHLQRLSILRAPAPTSIIVQLGKPTTMAELARVGLLARIPLLAPGRSGMTERWGMHSLVAEFVKERARAVAQFEAHCAAGSAYEKWVKEPGALWSDAEEGIYHLHEVGEGNRAFPMVQDYVIWLRQHGDYRRALEVVLGCEAAGASGDQLARCLLFQCQMRMLLGNYSSDIATQLDRGIALSSQESTRAYLISEKADLLMRQGRYEEAERLYGEALEIKRELFARDDLRYLDSLHNLGHTLFRLERYEEAERRFREVVAAMANSPAADSPSHAGALHELARVLLMQNRLDESEMLFKQAITIKEKVIGKEHPEYAVSLHELSRVLLKKEHTDAADALLREAMGIRRRTLGADHPDYGISLDQIGFLLLEKRDDPRSAEPLFKEALTIREKHLGREHPELCTTLFNLATAVSMQGRFPEAEVYAERAAAIFRKTHGENHPDTVRALILLVTVQNLLGKKEAQENAQKALQALHQAPEDHSNVEEAIELLQAVVAGNLEVSAEVYLVHRIQEARNLLRAGEIKRAIVELEAVAEDSERAAIPILEATSRIMLARLFLKLGELARAREEARRTLAIEEQLGNQVAIDKVRELLRTIG